MAEIQQCKSCGRTDHPIADDGNCWECWSVATPPKAGDILCARCGEVLSTNYEADRGHSGAKLYTHNCAPVKPVLRYADELTRAMDYLAQDERTLFIGQAVAVKGHALTATFQNVPREKLLEFPVAEELQMGHSIGLALQGFIPVTMFPRFNFLLCAMNQLVNHLDKIPQMSGCGYQPKVIIRTCIGSVRPLDPGPQHKGDLTEAFRLLCPNVEVVRLDEPEQIFPAYQQALERNGSTLLIEHGDYHNEK